MQPLARVADEVGQAPLDVEMHVLQVERPRKSPAADLLAYLGQAALDVGEVSLGHYARGMQHARVRDRAFDVELGKPIIERDRRGEALHEIGHRLAEPARPRLAPAGFLTR